MRARGGTLGASRICARPRRCAAEWFVGDVHEASELCLANLKEATGRPKATYVAFCRGPGEACEALQKPMKVRMPRMYGAEAGV